MAELDPETLGRVEQLVKRETEYLNRGDLDAWMNLFTDDGYYWMPLEPEQIDPEQHDSLIYDNRALMEIRRNNLSHPLSPSMQQTQVRSVRILSDLCIDETGSTGSIQVTAWVIAVIYHRQQDYFAGTVTYSLVDQDSTIKIQSKRVDLVNADGPLNAIMMYV